jgi:hypothetical protein
MMDTQVTKPNLRATPTTEETKAKDRAIVMLINSPIYFLDWAIIVFEKGTYRLVVSHKKRISTDKCYTSLKGAKIAFIKSYQYLAFSSEYKPQWSHPYIPYKKWLKEKLDKSAIKYN